MTVRRIASRPEAMRLLKSPNLYDAKEWIIDTKESGTLLFLHRSLSPSLSKQLRFVSPRSQPRGLCFVSETHIDNQATRGLRELTPDSASLLDRIIEATDQLPRSGQEITVTDELLTSIEGGREQQITFPEEIRSGSIFTEGSVQRVLVNRYERDSRAREECIKHYGTKCFLCGFDFVAVYGEIMSGLIHVHHLKPLSSVQEGYQVDPLRDMRPICPNCHAVVHRREPPYSVDDVGQLIKSRRGNA